MLHYKIQYKIWYRTLCLACLYMVPIIIVLIFYFYFIFIFKSLFILREREREQGRAYAQVGEGQRQRRERIPSRLHTVRAEPNVVLDPMNHEIMTWAKIKSWTTEPPKCPSILFLFKRTLKDPNQLSSLRSRDGLVTSEDCRNRGERCEDYHYRLQWQQLSCGKVTWTLET